MVIADLQGVPFRRRVQRQGTDGVRAGDDKLAIVHPQPVDQAVQIGPGTCHVTRNRSRGPVVHSRNIGEATHEDGELRECRAIASRPRRCGARNRSTQVFDHRSRGQFPEFPNHAEVNKEEIPALPLQLASHPSQQMSLAKATLALDDHAQRT